MRQGVDGDEIGEFDKRQIMDELVSYKGVYPNQHGK